MSTWNPPDESSWLAKYGLQLIHDLHQSDRLAYPELDLPELDLHPHPQVPRDQEDPPLPSGFKIGIIGAGVAGLYTAMILDSLGLEYEILEASDRLGGRVMTHHFSKDEFDFFDLGPMRFPKIKMMDRTFDLFDRLKIKLQTFRMTSPNQLLFYNSQRLQGTEPSPPDDYFRFSKAYGGLVDQKYISKGYQYWVGTVLDPFRAKFQNGWKEGWEVLMRYDEHSVRSIMAAKIDDSVLKKEKYPIPVIDWLETRSAGSQSFSSGFTETVISSLTFNPPPSKYIEGSDLGLAQVDGVDWFRVDGGTEVLIDTMSKNIKTQPIKNQRVTSITPCLAVGLDDTHVRVGVLGTLSGRSYDHVISTIPLSTLRLIDFGQCGLGTILNMAIRTLRYIPSVKIGLKFKKKWWAGLQIQGGGSRGDRIAGSVVYPSYGSDDPDEPAVLLASYTFSQEALRLGALIQGHGTPAEKYLVQLMLQDLAVIHDRNLADLEGLLVDHFAWDWSSYEYSSGAFAHFDAGQFNCLYPHITRPAASGKLHFVGEATSVNHGWIVGALDSAYRGVMEVLDFQGQEKLKKRLIQTWGSVDEVDLKLLSLQNAYGSKISDKISKESAH